MARIFLIVALLLAADLKGNSQTKAAVDIGIDEKLGSQVALDAVLKDENGKDVTLRQLVDKPTILILNFFRCPGICPILINNMVDMVNRMELEPGKDFRLVAVSFDPTDTPEMARQKKANYLNRMRKPFPPDAWHFLTGNAENTKAVADSVGFNFRKQGDMYMHPATIMVLTSKGILSRYLYGTSFLPADVVLAIREAAEGQVRPSISRVLSFCYSYDPEARRYIFSVTRVAGAATLVLACIFIIFVLKARVPKQKE
jgi:protein SCO1/2